MDKVSKYYIEDCELIEICESINCTYNHRYEGELIKNKRCSSYEKNKLAFLHEINNNLAKICK